MQKVTKCHVLRGIKKQIYQRSISVRRGECKRTVGLIRKNRKFDNYKNKSWWE